MYQYLYTLCLDAAATARRHYTHEPFHHPHSPQILSNGDSHIPCHLFGQNISDERVECRNMCVELSVSEMESESESETETGQNRLEH